MLSAWLLSYGNMMKSPLKRVSSYLWYWYHLLQLPTTTVIHPPAPTPSPLRVLYSLRSVLFYSETLTSFCASLQYPPTYRFYRTPPPAPLTSHSNPVHVCVRATLNNMPDKPTDQRPIPVHIFQCFICFHGFQRQFRSCPKNTLHVIWHVSKSARSLLLACLFYIQEGVVLVVVVVWGMVRT